MRLRLEQHIAPRTTAGRSRKIFRTIGIALALARLGGCRRRGLLGRSSPTEPLPLPVTPALRTALQSALGGATIASGGTPALPVPGGLLTRGSAIALQRMRWLEVLSTALQQAQTLRPPVGALP